MAKVRKYVWECEQCGYEMYRFDAHRKLKDGTRTCVGHCDTCGATVSLFIQDDKIAGTMQSYRKMHPTKKGPGLNPPKKIKLNLASQDPKMDVVDYIHGDIPKSRVRDFDTPASIQTLYEIFAGMEYDEDEINIVYPGGEGIQGFIDSLIPNND